MMSQPSSTALSLEAFLKQPETKPANEYIDGKIIQKLMSQGKHSQIQAEFVSVINQQVKQRKIACAFPELRCTFNGRSIIPDIAVFAWSRIPRDENGEIANHFALAPDWTIEILSSGQSQTKVTKNILHCLNQGSEAGWLIDPEEKTVFVYRPKQEIEVFDQPELNLPLPSLVSELHLTVNELFSWLLL